MPESNLLLTLEEPHAALLRSGWLPHQDQPGRLPGYRLLKENNARTVYRFELAGVGFVVKRFKPARGTVRWRESLSGSRGDREAHRLRHLARHGVSVPKLGGFWSSPAGDSGVLTVEVPGARALREVLAAHPPAAILRRYLADLAALARAVHGCGLLHHDFHLGNVLLDAQDRLWLIDLHRARSAGVPPLRERVLNLAQLGYSLIVVVNTAAARRLLREYLRAEPDSAGHALPRPELRRWARSMTQRMRELRDRHLEHRTLRCLRSGTSFHIVATDRWRVFAARGVAAPEVLRTIELHQARRAPDAALVKETTRVRVTVETMDTGHGLHKVFVKSFRPDGLRLRIKRAFGFGPARRAWVAAHGLHVRHLPTPDALACVEPTSLGGLEHSYLITSARTDALPLNRFVDHLLPATAGRGRSRRDAFLQALAHLVRRMHLAGVHHHDLKANNILAQETAGGFRFEFLDLDRVTFGDPPNEGTRLGNLAQLNAATPASMTRTDRLRWLRAYAVGRCRFADLRAAVADLMRRTIARRHVWPPQA